MKDIPAVDYIDLTPTWMAVLPSLMLLLTKGNAEGKQFAKDELKRMAIRADLASSKIAPKPALMLHMARSV